MDTASLNGHCASFKDWQQWKQLLQAALIEFDESKLPERIAQARSAVVKRTEELRCQQDHEQEKTELWDALNSLQTLQGMLRNRSK